MEAPIATNAEFLLQRNNTDGHYLRSTVGIGEMNRIITQTIRSRVPLRLGLAGGGTDLVLYSQVYGGAVLNCTIDRYAYAFISPRTDRKIVFRARDLSSDETHDLAPEIRTTSGLVLLRGVYNRMIRDFCGGEPLAITVSTTVDAPPGSGLGSSSALVVALVEAFRAYLDLPLSRYDVAQLAHDVERSDLGLAGGKQDQYAAAFGGVNFIEFLPDSRTIVNPLRLKQGTLNEFEASLVVCFTGVSRDSETIIREQNIGIKRSAEDTLNALHQLKADATAMKRALLAGDMRGMAGILGRSWIAKKQTAGAVTSPLIDELFDLAMTSGALGGKVSGAGGGGFMMFMVAPEDRQQVIRALNGRGAVASPVHLTPHGSETWIAPAPRVTTVDGAIDYPAQPIVRRQSPEWSNLPAGR
jgi:D-glycero-alpha-D-manno-heptose-7-phosphate kinase